MTTQIDHNKLLKKIAKERLKPYGIFQKGKSRTFLYDKGWFTIVIEFQPSSWSRGTYLNIGVDFNFYPREYFAFGYGYRETGFGNFKNEEQFTKFINQLCDLTIKRVQQLELKFQDLYSALNTADKEKGNDIWRLYEVAILNALTDKYEIALRQFNQISNNKCEHDWQIERKRITDQILYWAKDHSTFIDNLKNLIQETRKLKKLPMMTLDKLIEGKTTHAGGSANIKKGNFE